MFCTACGAALGPESKFCTGCGYRIAGGDSETRPKKTPSQPQRPKRIDWSSVGAAAGVGAAAIGMGSLMLWAVLDPAPHGSARHQSSMTPVTNQLVRLLPDSTKAWLATLFGAIMILGGLVFLGAAVYFIFKPGDAAPGSPTRKRVATGKQGR